MSKKITDLTALQYSDPADVYPVVDVSANTTKKVTTEGLVGGSTTIQKLAPYDFVESGCIWSGDAYGSTRAASLTSGVVWIGGKRLTVAAVSGRTFTASKDTYVDLTDNGDGTAAIAYNEATNNAASAALTGLRIGIVVAGASSIANAASINQGQEDRVLPIASSVPYSVSDSLGNLICPRDPNRKILGYRQRITDFTTASGSAIQITELSCPVIIPTGRKVKVTLQSDISSNNNAAGTTSLGIWDGTVGSGTLLNQSNLDQQSAANETAPILLSQLTTPTATSKTYNAAANTNGTGTSALSAAATRPIWIMVELA